MLEHGRGLGRWALEPVTRTATAGGAPESTLDPSDLLDLLVPLVQCDLLDPSDHMDLLVPLVRLDQ